MPANVNDREGFERWGSSEACPIPRTIFSGSAINYVEGSERLLGGSNFSCRASQYNQRKILVKCLEIVSEKDVSLT